MHRTTLCHALRKNAAEREQIETQLRQRISLTGPQRQAALEHLFGLTSEGSGGFQGVPPSRIFQKTRPLCAGYVRGVCAGVF